MKSKIKLVLNVKKLVWIRKCFEQVQTSLSKKTQVLTRKLWFEKKNWSLLPQWIQKKHHMLCTLYKQAYNTYKAIRWSFWKEKHPWKQTWSRGNCIFWFFFLFFLIDNFIIRWRLSEFHDTEFHLGQNHFGNFCLF